MTRIEQVVVLDAPEGWSVRACKEVDGFVACPLGQEDEQELLLLSGGFHVHGHLTAHTAEDVGETVMQQRQTEGYPSPRVDRLHRYRCTRYEWTDGFRDIRSWFVGPAPGLVAEVSAWTVPQGWPVEKMAAFFLGRLRWIAGTGDPNA